MERVLRHLGVRFGSRDPRGTLTEPEWAAYLRGLKPGPLYLIRVKYLMDRSAGPTLVELLRREVRSEYPSIPPRRITAYAIAAINECCRATHPLSAQRRADGFGMSRSRWLRDHAQRYRQVLTILYRWEYMAMQMIHKNQLLDLVDNLP